MKYIGIDLHSNKFNNCIIYDNNTKKHLTFGLKVSDINGFLKYVDKETFIMVEASTNTFRFVERIQNNAKETYVANTHKLHPFTKEYIFGKKTREQLKEINIDPVTDFQLNLLFNNLENKEKEIEKLKQYLMYIAKPYRKQIEILTSMKGVSIFTAIALISDISEIKRFKSSKKLSSYLRSAPGVQFM